MNLEAWIRAFDTLTRVLHIAATCTAFGGLVYARAVLWPSVERLPGLERAALLRVVIRRYAYIKWSGVVIVVVTGAYSLWRVWPSVTEPRGYLAAFALKLVAALGLFSITAALALPLPACSALRRRRGLWSVINIACAAAILTGAALMRAARGG